MSANQNREGEICENVAEAELGDCVADVPSHLSFGVQNQVRRLAKSMRDGKRLKCRPALGGMVISTNFHHTTRAHAQN